MRLAGTGRAVIVGAALGAGVVGSAGAQDQCAALIEARCLQTLGAGSTPAPGDICDAQLSAYRDCLAGVAAASPVAPRAPSGSGCSDATALSLWEDAKTENDCLGYETFLAACPSAPQARFASARTQRLDCGDAPRAAATPSPPGDASTSGAPADRSVLFRETQTELKRLGLYASVIDGDWGAASQRAMRVFQEHEGLAQDGRASARALERLQAASSADFSQTRPAQAAGTPRIGLQIQDLTEETAAVAGLQGLTGALVVGFEPRGPAAAAGFQTGDVVITFDAVAIGGAQDVARVVRARKPGDRVPVIVYRSRARVTLWVTLGRSG